jgi:hypothetical protein
MDQTLLAVIAIGLLTVLLLIIYLVDRVNALERDTRAAMHNLAPHAGSAPASHPRGPFGGLSGRPLWDAMTGAVQLEVDSGELPMMRQRYEQVLTWHIELTFDQGVRDAQTGSPQVPVNVRRINTLRGPVDSWLPDEPVNALYQAGQVYGRGNRQRWPETRRTIDEIAGELFARTQIPLLRRFSDLLMGPDPEQPQPSVVAAAVAAGSPPSPAPAPPPPSPAAAPGTPR